MEVTSNLPSAEDARSTNVTETSEIAGGEPVNGSAGASGQSGTGTVLGALPTPASTAPATAASAPSIVDSQPSQVRAESPTSATVTTSQAHDVASRGPPVAAGQDNVESSNTHDDNTHLQTTTGHEPGHQDSATKDVPSTGSVDAVCAENTSTSDNTHTPDGVPNREAEAASAQNIELRNNGTVRDNEAASTINTGTRIDGPQRETDSASPGNAQTQPENPPQNPVDSVEILQYPVAGMKRKRGRPRKQPAASEAQPASSGAVAARRQSRRGSSPDHNTLLQDSIRTVMQSVELPIVDHSNDPDSGEVFDVTSESAPKKKRARKSAPKKTKPPAAPNDAEDGAESDQESDPELHEIDANVTTLTDLVYDNALGKTSERERRMQKIDWGEVKRKQREGTAAEPAPSQQDGTPAATGATPAPPATSKGVQLRIVNGEMVVDETSVQIDRQAQAEAEAATMRVIDDADLTTRINRMTWINDKRRDPKERVPVHKMKSDPWSDAETDRFYEMLAMFGTDFFSISKMFPPRTRRQIKLKFVREERLDLKRINAALNGNGSAPIDLQIYADAIGQEVGDFKDPRNVEAELQTEFAEQTVEIDKKRVEAGEAQRQKQIQMDSRDRERSERDVAKKAQNAERAAIRASKRGQPLQGTGTF